MPAPLSLRIKERYMAKRADGLSQKLAADAVGISVRSAQRIDRGELQPEGQQHQRGRHWRTRADPLAVVWDSVLVPMLETAPRWNPRRRCSTWSGPSRVRSGTGASAPCSVASSNGGRCMARPGR